MKWTRDNQLQIVFVCMYQKVLQLLYIKDLLRRAKKKFISMYKDTLGAQAIELGAAACNFDFAGALDKILKQCEEEGHSGGRAENQVPRSFEDSKKWEQTKAGQNELMHNIKAEVRVGKGKDGRRQTRRNKAEAEAHESDDEPEPELDPGDDLSQVQLSDSIRPFPFARSAGRRALCSSARIPSPCIQVSCATHTCVWGGLPLTGRNSRPHRGFCSEARKRWAQRQRQPEIFRRQGE